MVFLKCNEGDTEINIQGSKYQIMAELNICLRTFFENFDDAELKKELIKRFLASMYNGRITGLEMEENAKIFDEAIERAQKQCKDPFLNFLLKISRLNTKSEDEKPDIKDALKEIVAAMAEKLGDLDDEE